MGAETARIIIVKCFDCGHEWRQSDAAPIVTCPKCGGDDLVFPETEEVSDGSRGP